tara:strand:- start:609 stop:1010 length:402 start_codon:yes stop_codon:yes gene_type:complete
LIPVPAESLDYVWPIAEPYLEKAITADYSVESFRQAIASREMQLWATDKDGELIAFAVTQILLRPNAKVLLISLVAGRDVRAWLPLIDDFKEWARAQGCSAIECYVDRERWSRSLAKYGWKKESLTLRKEINV